MAGNGCHAFRLVGVLTVLALLHPAALARIETRVEPVVEGIVYCQTCETHGSWSLKGAEPVAKATISVTCKDHKNRVKYYKAFDTDARGYFYAQLVGFTMDHYILDHPLHACTVKLVSSPLEHCNVRTNVNFGLDGCPLEYKNKVVRGENYEGVVYSAKALAFRPATC